MDNWDGFDYCDELEEEVISDHNDRSISSLRFVIEQQELRIQKLEKELDSLKKFLKINF